MRPEQRSGRIVNVLSKDSDALLSRQRRVRTADRRLRPYREARETWQREYILEILEPHDGDVLRAARAADIPATSLYRLIQRHRLRRSR